MTVDDLLKIDREESLLPVYFLYGPEKFFHTEILGAFERLLITPENRDFNLETFDAKSSSVEDWVGATKTLSFFGGRKLVAVRNLHEARLDDAGVQRLLEACEQPVASACLVLTADQADRKRKLYKKLTALKGAVSCSAPNESALIGWLKERAGTMGYSLSQDVARMMVHRVGAKPGRLARELDKVATYVGKNKKIGESDIAHLVGDVRQENVFAMTEALKGKDVERALSVLRNQLEHNEDPLKILGTLVWQMRMIWEVKFHQDQRRPAGAIAQLMGVKPFVVEKAMGHTRNFSRDQLRRGFAHLSQTDRDLKSTGQNPQILLEGLILKLCSTRF